MRGKRVDKSDPVEHPAILKIFADQYANAGPPGSGPQHRIPKCQPMFTDSPQRRTEIGGGARLSKHDGLPALYKGRSSFGGDARFPGNYTEQFAERLQCLNTISSPDRSLDQIGGSAMARAGCFVSGVDENVGIEADYPRSCISSRVKRRPPIGRPSRIKATICSIASSRSREAGA